MMTPAQIRVVDKVLTNHARGYSNDGMSYVAPLLFPTVTMPSRGMKRLEFGKEALRRYETRRARGALISRIKLGYEGLPVSLAQHAIGAQVPEEDVRDAQQGPGIDLQREEVSLTKDVIELDKERIAALRARDPGNYAADNKKAVASGAKWTNPDSDPLVEVESAKEVVRQASGRRPNTLVLPATAASAARVHPKIREHYKHTTSAVVTFDMLKAYFGVEHFGVADAVETLDGDTLEDIWGNDAILAYVNHSATASRKLPSYGYTYQLSGYPIVAPTRWDPDTRSWVNDYLDEFSPEVVGPDSGFLFQAVV